ncbi:hypothetical protein [Bradyrhizobium sp. URHD0069]|uniref:hypothetical protein n=1 Tax=Bradyrhizobium sp. URHD0069 TaxID=1380355 RepID=UPI000ABF9755|nr:hypothetical protein [Bradyrhizobium sp. URHD0069]
MAADNVVSITGSRPSQLGEPRQGLIEAIEDILAMAKSGRLQSFIGTGFTADGNRLACWGGHHENVYEMLGAINWLEHEYVSRQTNEA